MEADFQREYGIDLRHALWGPHPIGARRLRALIVGLPLDSALQRAVNPTWMWGHQEELLATVAELIDLGNRQFFAKNAKPGTRTPSPIKITRPGIKKRKATPADLRAMFGAGSVRYDGGG